MPRELLQNLHVLLHALQELLQEPKTMLNYHVVCFNLHEDYCSLCVGCAGDTWAILASLGYVVGNVGGYCRYWVGFAGNVWAFVTSAWNVSAFEWDMHALRGLHMLYGGYYNLCVGLTGTARAVWDAWSLCGLSWPSLFGLL